MYFFFAVEMIWCTPIFLQENIKISVPPFHAFCKAYQLGIISKGELYEGIFMGESIIRDLTTTKFYHHSEKYLEKYSFLKPIIDEIQAKFLDIELIRGDAATEVSHFVQEFQNIYGTQRLVELLKGLGKSKLYANYIYNYSDESMTKQKLFSFLLSNCHPLESDMQEAFNEMMKKEKIAEDRRSH